jgi:hypothetical protein
VIVLGPARLGLGLARAGGADRVVGKGDTFEVKGVTFAALPFFGTCACACKLPKGVIVNVLGPAGLGLGLARAGGADRVVGKGDIFEVKGVTFAALPFFGTCGFVLRRQYNTVRAKSARTAIPPTAPPTDAPIGLWDDNMRGINPGIEHVYLLTRS